MANSFLKKERSQHSSLTALSFEASFVPQATRHYASLSNRKSFSYYTFDATSDSPNPHPVLYFHGFPGDGLEGALCARPVAHAGGRVYAPDRPGFGRSGGLQGYIHDLWSFIALQEWESFSVVAVAGGGLFALAFVESYLERQSSGSKMAVVLRSVALVSSLRELSQNQEPTVQDATVFRSVTSHLPFTRPTCLRRSRRTTELGGRTKGVSFPSTESAEMLANALRYGLEKTLQQYPKNQTEDGLPRMVLFSGRPPENTQNDDRLGDEARFAGPPEYALFAATTGMSTLIV